MAIRQISIEGYRSIQKLVIEFNQLNIISGHNGSGKTNLYKAIYLLSQAAKGQFAATLANEGGMASIMWAGEKRRANFNQQEVRLNLAVECDEFSYSLSCGFPPNVPPSMFALDPEIKEELVWQGHSCRPSTIILERKQNSAFMINLERERVTYPFCLNLSESVFSQLKDPHLYPELSHLGNEMKNWRFYHNFRTDSYSEIRHPQVCTRTPVLADDGHDLAAALQTIIEIGDEDELYQAFDEAFPGSRLCIVDPDQKARFEIQITVPGILRPLLVSEVSDGTLRYLCLIAVLLSPRPPSVLILNEPETSLHPDLIKPLGNLICKFAQASQLIIVTHSAELIHYLEKNGTGVKSFCLRVDKYGTNCLEEK